MKLKSLNLKRNCKSENITNCILSSEESLLQTFVRQPDDRLFLTVLAISVLLFSAWYTAQKFNEIDQAISSEMPANTPQKQGQSNLEFQVILRVKFCLLKFSNG